MRIPSLRRRHLCHCGERDLHNDIRRVHGGGLEFRPLLLSGPLRRRDRRHGQWVLRFGGIVSRLRRPQWTLLLSWPQTLQQQIMLSGQRYLHAEWLMLPAGAQYVCDRRRHRLL
jgi:hypothetical protein